jgi:hypothetical protein
MQIRIRSTGQVMYEEAFRQHIQQFGGPTWVQTTTEILNELGADVVFDGPQPTLTRYQVASAGPAVQENGQWYTSFTVSDMSDEAKTALDTAQAVSVREQRDAKLAKCDWTQAVDCPLTNKTDWATYRQALRDLTKESGFPWDITWPTDPTGAK